MILPLRPKREAAYKKLQAYACILHYGHMPSSSMMARIVPCDVQLSMPK
jgi:hypothetical protein